MRSYRPLCNGVDLLSGKCHYPQLPKSYFFEGRGLWSWEMHVSRPNSQFFTQKIGCQKEWEGEMKSRTDEPWIEFVWAIGSGRAGWVSVLTFSKAVFRLPGWGCDWATMKLWREGGGGSETRISIRNELMCFKEPEILKKKKKPWKITSVI